MSTQTIYTISITVLKEVRKAIIFHEENFNSTVGKYVIKAKDGIDELISFFEVSRRVSASSLKNHFEKIINALNKAVQKTKGNEYIVSVFHVITELYEHLKEKDIDAIEAIDLSIIERVNYSDSDSNYTDDSDENSEDDSDEDDSEDDDDDEDDSGDEGMSEDEDEKYPDEISQGHLTQINRYVSRLFKAKIFTKDIDIIIEGSEDVTVSDIFSKVKEDMLDFISKLSRYLNRGVGDIEELRELLEIILEDLEICYNVIDNKNEEQLYLVKDRVEWLFLLFDMNNKEISKELKIFDLKGISMSR